MPHKFCILPKFEEDVDAVEEASYLRFGQRQTDRYMTLIDLALDILKENPKHPARRSEQEWARDAWSFHLKSAKKGMRASHRIYYFHENDAGTAIARLLHTSMDPKLHSFD